MKKKFGTALLVAMLAISVASAEKTKKAASGIEGTWVATSAKVSGKELPADFLKKANMTVKFAEGKYEVMAEGKVVEKGAYKIKVTKSTSQIDMIAEEGKNKGKPQMGLFKLKDDTLTIVAPSEAGKPRPTEFASKAGSDMELTEFARKK